jgi:hypothetical protein
MRLPDLIFTVPVIVDHMVCSLVAVLHVRDPSKACTKEDWFPFGSTFPVSSFAVKPPCTP